MSLGANVLCILPGCVFDRYGAQATLLCGAVLACGGLLLASVASEWIYLGFFCFGLGASFFNIASVLTILNLFPERTAGSASAAMLLVLALGMSFQTSVYSSVFEFKFDSYLVYMIGYSALAALLPVAILSVVSICPSPERGAGAEEPLKLQRKHSQISISSSS